MKSIQYPLWLLSLALTLTANLHADDTLTSLEQRVQALEQQLAVTQATVAASTPSVKMSLGDRGLVATSVDGQFSARLSAYLQIDERSYFRDRIPANPDTLVIRRARLSVDATMHHDFQFRLLTSWDGGTAALQDIYGEYRPLAGLGLRAGRFKVPIDIERLQADVNYLFAETALTSNLSPNRDLGVQLGGDLQDGMLNYAVGIFNGVADSASGDTDPSNDKDLVARVFAKPFKRTTGFAKGLGLGVAGSFGKRWGTASSTQLPSYRTDGQQTFFSYTSASSSTGTAIADGISARLVPQLYFSHGPFGLLSELAISQQEVRRANVRHRLSNRAWQTAVSYVITGEAATLNGVAPAHVFDWRKHQWGAWEVAARYADLSIDRDAFSTGLASRTASSSHARAYTAGVNWYLSKLVRTYLDFTQTRFSGGATTTADRENENVLTTRLQFIF